MRKISPNELLVWETCKRKWGYQYIEKRKESKQLLAFYRFSSCLHGAMEKHMLGEVGVHDVFEESWKRYEDGKMPLIYKDGHWGYFLDFGHKLLDDFMVQYDLLCLSHLLVEKKLVYYGDNFELNARPDAILQGEGFKPVVFEIKVTETPCKEDWVHWSDQLTACAMCANQMIGVDCDIDVIVCNPNKNQDGILWVQGGRTEKHYVELERKINDFISETSGVAGVDELPRRVLYSWSSPCAVCNYTETCLK